MNEPLYLKNKQCFVLNIFRFFQFTNHKIYGIIMDIFLHLIKTNFTRSNQGQLMRNHIKNWSK